MVQKLEASPIREVRGGDGFAPIRHLKRTNARVFWMGEFSSASLLGGIGAAA